MIENAYAEIEAILVSIIEPHAAHGIRPEQLAHTLAASMRGINESARDADDLREMLAGLAAMTMGTLTASEPATT